MIVRTVDGGGGAIKSFKHVNCWLPSSCIMCHGYMSVDFKGQRKVGSISA